MSDYVSTKELAERTGTSEGFWFQRRLSGDGPVFRKLGRRVVYRMDDVEAWLDQRSRRSTSEAREPAA